MAEVAFITGGHVMGHIIALYDTRRGRKDYGPGATKQGLTLTKDPDHYVRMTSIVTSRNISDQARS